LDQEHCVGRVEAATGGAAELIRPAAAAESAVDRLRADLRQNSGNKSVEITVISDVYPEVTAI
jgi:hypothetical protein